MEGQSNSRTVYGVVAIVAVAAIAITALVVRGNSSQKTSVALPTTPNAAQNAAIAANQIQSCMSAHGMSSPTVVSTDYPVEPTFFHFNPNPWSYASSIYGTTAQPATTIEACIWPPANGVDATGFSLISLTPVPGAKVWPGEVTAGAYADIVDTTCHSILVTYLGEHTGTTWNNTTSVSSGQLASDTGASELHYFESYQPGHITDLASWANALGYVLQPQESAVLYAGSENVTAAHCTA